MGEKQGQVCATMSLPSKGRAGGLSFATFGVPGAAEPSEKLVTSDEDGSLAAEGKMADCLTL